jgi:hypothetical protein
MVAQKAVRYGVYTSKKRVWTNLDHYEIYTDSFQYLRISVFFPLGLLTSQKSVELLWNLSSFVLL